MENNIAMLQNAIKLEEIFTPSSRNIRDHAYTTNPTYSKFAHYTSAESALKIISSKRLWLRNTTCMSDYSEVQHGYNLIHAFFSDPQNKKLFLDTFDKFHDGIASQAINLFDQWWNEIKFNTFIASISEHDTSEDAYGRLSMWRAFGNPKANVAIVFKVPAFSGSSDQLKLQFNPVIYSSENNANSEMLHMIGNVNKNHAFIQSIGKESLFNSIFNLLMTSVTCVKHEAFKEEREWRLIYSPKLNPSPLMESSVEAIGGIPQTVYKAPFDQSVSDLLKDIDFKNLFDKLIIGPSAYPWAMYQGFVDTLKIAGIADPETKVFTSNIPIRGMS